jgi:hypothetical protein
MVTTLRAPESTSVRDTLSDDVSGEISPGTTVMLAGGEVIGTPSIMADTVAADPAVTPVKDAV